jgi:hypothetical protein
MRVNKGANPERANAFDARRRHGHIGASKRTRDLFAQLSLRILDMQLESAQCLAAAVKRSSLRLEVRECIESAIQRHHGLAAFGEPDAVVAFAELSLLEPSSPDFKAQAEPLMQRIRRTPYLIPIAWAQEFLAALPDKCGGSDKRT